MLTTSFTPAVLIMPYVIKTAGVILGTGIFVIGMLVSLWGLNFMSEIMNKHQVYNYSRLTEKSLGSKFAYGCMEVFVILYELGVIIGNQIILAQLILQIFDDAGVDIPLRELGVLLVVNIVIIYPLSLIRSMGAFRYAALLAVFALVYLTISCIIQFPFFASTNAWENIVWFNVDIEFFNVLNITVFTFFCHTNLAAL
jgi:amino acid permease